jgi:hypothetical protein
MPPEEKDIEDVKDGEKEEEYVAVEDDAAGAPPDDGEKEGDGEDEGEGEDAGEGEGEGEGDDKRLAADQEEEDEGDKKARRKVENKNRRKRQKDARDRTERELNFLRTRNQDLEQRFSRFEQETDARVTGSEIANVDGAINKARADLQLANTVIQQAVDQNDGKNLAEALDHRDTIRDNLRDLNEAKSYLSTTRRSGGDAIQQQLDPRHVAHAQSFMIDNDWWDPSGRDEDSVKVLEIDRALVTEGFDPTQKDYWDELRTRTEAALPQRFDTRSGDRGGDSGDAGSGNGQQPSNKNRGPSFRTGGRERPLKKNEVYISPERKSAMEEAGVWDDPVLRNKYLKAYATYDTSAAEGA